MKLTTLLLCVYIYIYIYISPCISIYLSVSLKVLVNPCESQPTLAQPLVDAVAKVPHQYELPISWRVPNRSGLVQLDEKSEEFAWVMARFDATLLAKSHRIDSVERIDNVPLYQYFKQRSVNLANRSPSVEVRTKNLWWSTGSRDEAQRVCDVGWLSKELLDLNRLHGKSLG